MASLVAVTRSQLSQYRPGGGAGGGASRGPGRGGSRQGAGAGPALGRPGTVTGGGGGNSGGGGNGDGGDHQGLDWLRESVPGEPGVDYPVYSLPVPDTQFRWAETAGDHSC